MVVIGELHFRRESIDIGFFVSGSKGRDEDISVVPRFVSQLSNFFI